MSCHCPKELLNRQLQKIEGEVIEVARKMVRTASDPISAVIKFLHERPEGASLPGYVVNKILLEVFESESQVPGLVKLLSGHVREISRQRNVIAIFKEHPAVEKWGSYLIKQADRIKFEVSIERGKLVLNEIGGLVAIEHGVELPLDRILVNPPKLEVTVRLGLLRPRRVIDMA